MAVNARKDNMDDYSTPDTPLAAYLVSLGYELKEIKYKNTKAHFVLETDGRNVLDDVFKFRSHTAEGNIHNFFSAYRTLIRSLKGGQNES